MDTLWLIFFALLGASLGSFLNVVIWRVPRGESIVFPGSHCPRCGYPIKWFDNVPLVSWFVLLGRCRQCKVRISPRYVVIEAVTALLVAGWFAWVYILQWRTGVGEFNDTYLAYVAYAAMACGLLACSMVDITHWIVPLEICWVVSLIGIAAATIQPPPETLLPRVPAVIGAMGLATMLGLAVSLVLLRRGVLRPSFIDASDKAEVALDGRDEEGPSRIVAVAATKADGVNPRLEILHEVAYLLPAMVLASGTAALACWVPEVGRWFRAIVDPDQAGPWAHHLAGLQAAVVGYLVAGGWVWGMRILGTLGFGKEAMGLGDVHLLGAVGAVTGWIVPSLTFFAAPVLGLLWAVWLMTSRRQRELPYGPWLAAAAGLVVLFYDHVMDA
ncbi:MAG: prepilin peptidase, partial [Planctomycetota bacterium]